jgi:hypothetical protein
VNIPSLLHRAQRHIDSGREHGKNHAYIFALTEYKAALTVLQIIDEEWMEGRLELTPEEEFTLAALKESAQLGVARLLNGHPNPPRDRNSEFVQVVKDILADLERLFV